MTLKGIFILLFFLAIINGTVSHIKIRKFLQGTRAIDTRIDLEKFKDMVRTQMKMALLQIAIQGIMLFVGLYGLIVGKIGLLLIIFLNGIIIVISLFFKKTEKMAKSMKSQEEEFRKEYNEICIKWDKNPLADF